MKGVKKLPVITTDQWLQEYMKKKKCSLQENIDMQRATLCEPLTSFFEASSAEIHHHLLHFGLFYPNPLDKQVIEKMCKGNQWRTIEKVYNNVRTEWKGPDIPIFIFPSDFKNKELRKDSNGRSGLAFQDKLVLFISADSTDRELESLITHEYNHVCRLHYLDQPEERLTLLDSLILEGLAEAAVAEKLGETYLAKWTSIYSLDFTKTCWEKWLKPNVNVRKTDMRHDQYMYGYGKIPKWAGYNVGYHLVTSFLENEAKSVQETLTIPSSKILQGSQFSIDNN